MAKKVKKINPKTKKMINTISSLLYFIFCFIALLLTINIFKLNMLPFKITFLIFTFGIISILIFGLLCLHKKIKWKIKIVSDIIVLILSLILFFANHYIDRTISFFRSITGSNYEVENYYVLVLKESDFSNEKDLLDKKVGYVSKLGNNDKALEELKNKVVFETVDNKSIFDLGNALLKKQNDAILLADYHKAILDEQIEDFDDKVKIIYQFSIKKETKVESNSVNVTKDSFNIFLSGIDTYGEIDSIARSDVNMIITINPVTKQVLLTSIPRDYYVSLSCYNEKDKLTHAGMYGIDCSIGTIENLLGIDINYYVRVNFSSLINLVDVLGGVEVYSDYTFNTYGYQFNKGYNYVNGKYALAFSRARYNFADGDRQRVKNQQAVITAIANKAMSPAILSKYTNILDALKDSFQTNMGMSDIQELAKFQIDKMPKWKIASISLNGSDSENYTYSYGTQKLYVMEPDILTVDYAHETINKVMKGEAIDVANTETKPVSSNNQVINKTTTTTSIKSTTTTKTTTTITTTKKEENKTDNNSNNNGDNFDHEDNNQGNNQDNKPDNEEDIKQDDDEEKKDSENIDDKKQDDD
ncbi:MAG: LCP family protein [Bacilli bacterium]|nr:LCP family protein [Bacilli bacterium]